MNDRQTRALVQLWNKKLVWLSVGLVLAAIGFLLGRWSMSVSPHDQGRLGAARESRIAGFQDTLDAQRREIAALEVGRRVDRESQIEAQRMLGELQSQVARLNQDIEFCHGVLEKEFGASSVRVQSVVVRSAGSGSFLVELTVVRATARDAPLRGSARIALSGTRRGALVEVSMLDLSPGRRREVPFVLRYFETLRIPIKLPDDLRPEALTVELLLAPGARVVDRRIVSWTVAP